MNSLVGQTIHGYEIGDRVGSGGYGEVYRAHQLSVKRDVAIKVILPQYASDPKFVSAFESEAELVAALEHPFIVPLHDYWQDEHGAFLVMRYIRGGSLRAMLAKGGALSLVRTLRLIEQIADALNAAHEAGVVHRDLKPDNILIDQRGSAYLTDFGIAKQTGDENASATDAIKGTFAYLSPEQIQQTDVSPRTDIYALGVVLYEMLAGQHPFHETPMGMMVMKHLQEPLPDIRDIREDLSEDVNRVIQRATAKDPSERYATALAFIDDLRASTTGGLVREPAPAVPVSKKKPTTVEERNRYAMLENVRKFWVEGVLENSLHDTAMIDLGLKADSGAVDNPWDTVVRTATGEERLSEERIVDVLDRLNGKLLILGDPGSGKTTTLLGLARDLLARAEADEGHPIPVVFNLSSWSERQPPLTEWLVEELSNKYQVPRKVGEKWVSEDELLLLLDGLDEVTPSAREDCVNAINTFRSEHGFVDMVVCSRIKDYEALTNQLRLNGAIVIQPLDDKQIVTYLSNLSSDAGVVRELIARDEQLRELAQSPLMLSIMVLAYRGRSAGDVPDYDDVEAQRQHLFDIYVERMFERNLSQPYSTEDTRHYLSWLAGKMSDNALSVFHIEQLQPWWLSSDEQVRRFPNQIRWMTGAYLAIPWAIATVLFFMASGATSNWSLVLGLPLAVLAAMVYAHILTQPHTLQDMHSSRWQDTALVGGVIGLWLLVSTSLASSPARMVMNYFILALLGLTVYRVHKRAIIRLGCKSDRIIFSEKIKFRLWHRYPGLVFEFFVIFSGIVLIAFILFPESLEWNARAIVAGLAFGIPNGIFSSYVLTGFSVGELSVRTSPNQGLRNTFNTLLRFVLYVALLGVIYLLGWWAMGVPFSQAFIGFAAIVFFFALGDTILSHGGTPITQHLWLRYQLEQDGSVPHDLTSFLDYASAIILLRKVGGGYIFIHRYLLEYFAALEPERREG